MAADRPGPAFTDDLILGGRLRLRQPARGHRVGHDAILLAAATPAAPGEVAVDLGAGVGAAGLALAHRVPGLVVRLVEIDPQLVELAQTNATRNGLGEYVRARALDVGAPAAQFRSAGLGPATADRVLMNPPFRAAGQAQASPDVRRRIAHVAPPGMLAIWLGTAARLLRHDGTLSLIFRADGLADLLGIVEEAFGAIAILPIHPKPAAPAIRIIVRAVKGSRAPLVLLPGLTLNDAHGRPSVEAEAVLREANTLPLALP
jgi:tRNA1(Val) A37 N6-methylase TrmN6